VLSVLGFYAVPIWSHDKDYNIGARRESFTVVAVWKGGRS